MQDGIIYNIRKKIGNSLLIIFVSILFLIIFSLWLLGNPPYVIAERVPGLDNRPKTISETDNVIIGEFFESYNLKEEILPGSWPRFRGSDYDNICKDTTPLSENWPADGPPVLWQHELGEGYAAPAIYKGKVFILDYDEQNKADALRCFSLKTGEELWKRWYHVALKRNHGMSRTIPAVNENYIVTIGPRCHVMCLNQNNGELLWSLDLEKDMGTETPNWYTGQCPLIDNNTAIIAVGGRSILAGIDCATGNIIWETPNPDNWKMSHSSVLPATIHGKKMYLYNAIGGICGISAEGDDTGELLWKTSGWSPPVVVPSPVYAGNNEIIVTAGYGAGGSKIKINKNNSGYEATVIEKHTPREGLASEQHTPVLSGEFIWTILPKDAGTLRNQLVCYHISDINIPVWASGKENRYGLGPYMICRDKMFLLNDDGELFFFRFNSNSISILANHKVLNGTDAWSPMAMADGYLLLRDANFLLCLYVGE